MRTLFLSISVDLFLFYLSFDLLIFVQHYLQIYEDVYKLRDLYYMKYMNALRKHVDKQREEIKKKSTEMRQHLEFKGTQEVYVHVKTCLEI